MNYRHAYHAGNFADVIKHAVLCLVIEHLKLKVAPFRIIDTHAGAGLYDLEGPEALKTTEWREGIGRLTDTGQPPLPGDIADLLAPYLSAIASLNPSGRARYYPGSPHIALALMREDDRLIANELHPEDAALLAANIGRDRRAKVLRLDGWTALKALLPPKERRGVVLIDPPFEVEGELERLVSGLKQAMRRFAGGTYLLWYPIKDPRQIEPLHDAIAADLTKVLLIELLVRAPRHRDALNGCGLLIINPPHTLRGKLEILLPFLSERLRQGGGACARIELLGIASSDT